MTVQELNQLGEKQEMEQVMLKPYRRIWQPSPDTSVHIDKKTESGFEVSVLVSSKEQAKIAINLKINEISLIMKAIKSWFLKSELVHRAGKLFYLAMPYILRKDTDALCLAHKQILCRKCDGRISYKICRRC